MYIRSPGLRLVLGRLLVFLGVPETGLVRGPARVVPGLHQEAVLFVQVKRLAALFR